MEKGEVRGVSEFVELQRKRRQPIRTVKIKTHPRGVSKNDPKYHWRETRPLGRDYTKGKEGGPIV